MPQARTHPERGRGLHCATGCGGSQGGRCSVSKDSRMRSNRRQFFKVSAATAACLGLGDLQFLSRLPRLSAAEAVIPPNVVRFSPEIETLVQMIEDTPRERLLEEVASRIHRGLSYRQVLTALMLAGVRNIQPRPVGFKFHSVLVVNSAHLASLSSPDSARWLP